MLCIDQLDRSKATCSFKGSGHYCDLLKITITTKPYLVPSNVERLKKEKRLPLRWRSFREISNFLPARVEVDIVYEKAFGAPRQLGLYTPQGSWERLTGCSWPNDQGANVKRI